MKRTTDKQTHICTSIRMPIFHYIYIWIYISIYIHKHIYLHSICMNVCISHTRQIRQMNWQWLADMAKSAQYQVEQTNWPMKLSKKKKSWKNFTWVINNPPLTTDTDTPLPIPIPIPILAPIWGLLISHFWQGVKQIEPSPPNRGKLPD